MKRNHYFYFITNYPYLSRWIRMLYFLPILFLGSCLGDEVELPEAPLNGKIANSDWSYGSANGYIFSSDGKYNLKFLNDDEPSGDPCAIPRPSLTHVTATLVPFVGSFVVDQVASGTNQARVTFDISPSVSLVASSGFVEIFAIQNQTIIGYIQAVLDEENSVEGRFQAKLCNLL